MVDDPVGEGRGGDEPGLALVEGEQVIAPGAVEAVLERRLQGQEVRLQVELEQAHLRRPALALARLAPGEPEVVEPDDPLPQPAKALHGQSVSAASRRSAGRARP